MDCHTVLVVDDDREIVQAIAINLRNEGYEVLCAYDGLQALDMIQAHTVHLIILDVMMPRLDGLSTTLKIRQEKNIPIIILLSYYPPNPRIPIKFWAYPWGRMTMLPSRSTPWN